MNSLPGEEDPILRGRYWHGGWLPCRRLGYKSLKYSEKALLAYLKEDMDKCEHYLEKALYYAQRSQNEIQWNQDVVETVAEVLQDLDQLMRDHDRLMRRAYPNIDDEPPKMSWRQRMRLKMKDWWDDICD